MPTGSPYMTFYMMTVVIFSLSVTIYEILAVKMCMTLTFRIDWPRSIVNIPIPAQT